MTDKHPAPTAAPPFTSEQVNYIMDRLEQGDCVHDVISDILLARVAVLEAEIAIGESLSA